MKVLKVAGTAIGVCALLVATLAWLIFFGAEPIPYWIAEARVYGIEHRLTYGESRAKIEAEFGKGFLLPTEPNVVTYTYSYGAICVEDDLNVVVTYDQHNRMRSWRRADSGSGC
jgi:hypothetical protein